MEGFAADRDADDGTPLGPLLFDLVLRRELALLNPPSGFLLQSKAVQAVVWGLYERNEVFDEHEREAIARSFLPTYCDPPAEGPYVVKPALGREGASVEIVAASLRTGRGPAPEAAPVYQRYVPMPRATVMTERGPRECCVLDTVFVVAGEATAVGRRLGGPVTDGAAYFTAIGVRA
jgi:glutathionylspermidine synthase